MFPTLLFLLCCNLLAIFCPINGQIDPGTKVLIDELINNVYIPENMSPALGLSIVRGGGVYYSTAYGTRDIDNTLPANNDTLFFIGSNSKSFTATLVIKVLHEHFPELGEFVLDTPITKLLPSYNFTLIDRYRSETTTFRDILSHRTGTLPEGIGSFFGAIGEASELAYRQRYAPEVVSFRTNFVYDNGYFAMAGELAAAISGVPYLTMLDNLFSQIEMQSTTYIKSTDDHDNMFNRALGYYRRNDQLEKYNSELYKRTICMNAAGGILSSANDMTKYMQFHLHKGRVGNVQVIPEEVMKWLEKISNPLPSTWKTVENEKIATELGYSLGLILGVYDGWLEIKHGGYLTPFNSQMSLFPALNLGIFTVTSGPGRLLPNVSHATLHHDIFDIIQGQGSGRLQRARPNISSLQPRPQLRILPDSYSTRSNWNSDRINVKETMRRKPKETLSGVNSGREIRQNEEILGHYGNGQSGEMDVIQKMNDSGVLELYMSYGEWGQAWMRPVQDSTGEDYLLVWDSDIVQEFYSNDPSTEIVASFDGIEGTITFLENGYPSGTWIKDQYLDDLPAIPWAPDSCGPERKLHLAEEASK